MRKHPMILLNKQDELIGFFIGHINDIPHFGTHPTITLQVIQFRFPFSLDCRQDDFLELFDDGSMSMNL